MSLEKVLEKKKKMRAQICSATRRRNTVTFEAGKTNREQFVRTRENAYYVTVCNNADTNAHVYTRVILFKQLFYNEWSKNFSFDQRERETHAFQHTSRMRLRARYCREEAANRS